MKLWPLFVKLLGKVSWREISSFYFGKCRQLTEWTYSLHLFFQALHRSGSFINSLLQLEELGFRSGSPVVKKIAFIAWKSLIDNFALNPGMAKLGSSVLCASLMQHSVKSHRQVHCTHFLEHDPKISFAYTRKGKWRLAQQYTQWLLGIFVAWVATFISTFLTLRTTCHCICQWFLTFSPGPTF